MTNTPIVTAPVVEAPSTSILQRIAPPFFAFSMVLFLSLLASQTFLLPQLTTFRVGEVNVSVDEAMAYERTLRADVLSLEDDREQFVLPYIDDTHDALMTQKRRTPSIIDIRSRVETAMRRVVEEADAAVSVDAVLFENETNAVTVRGSVIDPKPSSMAVLAAAVDAVKALPDVADLIPPTLTREQVGDGYRSPFKFTFTLNQ